MTISGPRVLDFTDPRQKLSVEVAAGPAFELLTQLFTFTSICEGEMEESDLGREWLEEVRAKAGDDLVTRLERLGCCGQVWFALLSEAYVLEEPRSTAGLLARLEAADPIELRRRMLMMLHKGSEGREDLVDRAAAGDLEALEALESDETEGLRDLFSMEPSEMKDLLVGAVRDFDERVFEGGAQIIEVLARDAREKRAMARTMAPERLVEAATNGVTFAMQPEVSGVVLVPSVAIRPFVLITAHGSLRIFIYGVSEEMLSADPSAPPSWLLGFYKALADERRLRILHALAEGPKSFSELTEHLGLAKSTVHHHVRTLRRAGLVRVVVGEEKEYQLRTDAVPEAGRLLESYLSVAASQTEGIQR